MRGSASRRPHRARADDIGFITAMVSAISRAVPVDPGRVYATGISNGAIMAYDVACHTTIFAAIGFDSRPSSAAAPPRLLPPRGR